jgi:hypothetical protein
MSNGAHLAMGATTMFTKTVIALSAALVVGTATAAVAMINVKAKAHNPRAAFAAQGAPAAVRGPSAVAGYDTSGVAIFQRQLTPTCPLSLKQQSRC